ncbi:MAG: hypothetical protein ACE5GA_04905, partial [Candidatus Zixiibacteriota bacterium]
ALIKVESDAQAVERRFVGSPSIRVEGEDVATVENNNQEYSMRCRVYFADSGMTGLPPRSKLLDAIAGALEKAEDK